MSIDKREFGKFEVARNWCTVRVICEDIIVKKYEFDDTGDAETNFSDITKAFRTIKGLGLRVEAI